MTDKKPHRSLWLKQALGGEPGAAPLAGDVTCDVVIIGGGFVGPRWNAMPARAKMVTADFRRYYPSLNDVRITHDWAGPIDRTSMTLGCHDKWSENGLVNAPHRLFPVEPVRYLGAHVVREAIKYKERREALELQPPKLVTSLARLAPSGTEDKE